MLEALCNYGPIKYKKDYKIISDGFDWYLIGVGGLAIYVPKWVF